MPGINQVNSPAWYQTVQPGKGCEFKTMKDDYLKVRNGAEARNATVEEVLFDAGGGATVYNAKITETDGRITVFSFFDKNKDGIVNGNDQLSFTVQDKDGHTLVHLTSGDHLRVPDPLNPGEIIEIISDSVDDDLVVDLIELGDNLEAVKSAKDEAEQFKAIQAAQDEYKAFVCPG